MTCKIYKLNGTRCIRKFDSIEDAQRWCWTVNTGDNYRIEVTVNGSVRNLYV